MSIKLKSTMMGALCGAFALAAMTSGAMAGPTTIAGPETLGAGAPFVSQVKLGWHCHWHKHCLKWVWHKHWQGGHWVWHKHCVKWVPHKHCHWGGHH